MFPIETTDALSRIPTLPDYVKKASYTSESEKKDLPSRLFADKSRTLPTHTKAATYVSAVEHYRTGKKDERVEAHLKKSAEFFGIEKDVAEVAALFQPKEGVFAKNAHDFALKIESNFGKPKYFFPILTEDEIIKSASSLEKNKSMLTFDLRQAAAVAIIKRARELGLNMTEEHGFLYKAAGLRPAPASRVRHVLSYRVAAVKSAAYKERYQQIAEVVPNNDEPLPNAVKVAQLIDFADRESNLHTKYGSDLETPEEICFQGAAPRKVLCIKVASELVPVSTIKEAGLKIDDISFLGDEFINKVREPVQLYSDTGGIDFAKLAACVDELSDNDRVLFNKAVKRVIGC